MLKLSEEMSKIISTNDFLSVGFETHLFNLSRLSELLRPLLERRLSKSLSKSSILMALSRLQKSDHPTQSTKIPSFHLNSLQEECRIIPNVFLAVFVKNTLTEKQLQLWKKWIEDHKGPLWRDDDSELSSFVTSVGFLEEMSHIIELKPRKTVTNLTAIEFKAPQDLTKRTQLLHQLLWSLALQGVDLIHLQLNSKKILFVLKERDVKKII